MTRTFRTWVRFNIVGVLGIGVQLLTLALLTGVLKLDYLAATAIAVETAVLHNFRWHERWTWMERTREFPAGMTRRLVRFHFSNGLISLCGNLVLMWLLVSNLGMAYFFANILAIAACSIVNFWASDRLVFASKGNHTCIEA